MPHYWQTNYQLTVTCLTLKCNSIKIKQTCKSLSNHNPLSVSCSFDVRIGWWMSAEWAVWNDIFKLDGDKKLQQMPHW